MQKHTIISNAGYYARNRYQSVYRVTCDPDGREYRTRNAAEKRLAELTKQQNRNKEDER